MNAHDNAVEFERSLARAKSSLDRHDVQEFRAAIRDLQKLVEKNGRWESAVNFLARSLETPPSKSVPAPTRPYRD